MRNSDAHCYQHREVRIPKSNSIISGVCFYRPVLTVNGLTICKSGNEIGGMIGQPRDLEICQIPRPKLGRLMDNQELLTEIKLITDATIDRDCTGPTGIRLLRVTGSDKSISLVKTLIIACLEAMPENQIEVSRLNPTTGMS